MKHYGDVSKINGAEVGPVDIITFGSPCQDLSVAGKRAGIQDGERSNLFFEAIRIIKEMREATNDEYPKYAVWENVPGAFSSNKGHDFHAVLEAFCSVCDGAVSIPKPYDAKQTDKLVWNKAGEIVGNNYSIAWRTLDAQYWGVPQRRKRIYLVADFTGRCAGEILFKPDSLRGNLPQGNEAGEGATTDAVGSVDGSVGAAGVVSKGNGDCFIMPEKHMSLSVGGGQAGQGYPCTVYSFDSLSSNSMKSSNPFSGCRAVEVAKCIDTTYPDPSKNQGGVAVVECLNPWDCQSKRIYNPDGIYCTLPAMDCGGANNQAVIFSAAGFCQGASPAAKTIGYQEEIAPTVKGAPICYDARGNGDGETLCFNEGQITSPTNGNNPQWNEPCHTLSATDNRAPTIILKKPPRKYIIRRLTPTECARLQGFPDTWGHLAPYNPDDAEFWEEVRKTDLEIRGKQHRPVKSIEKWYEKLHTDSAEYKMWGNGLALPNAEYVLRGIAEHGAKTLGSLFDGSGGFPLAGVLNGIKPIWASEVEPYPIAVTKSRFKEVRLNFGATGGTGARTP